MCGSRPWWSVVVFAWLVGCGNPPDRGEGCDLLPGELVVSEIMPNPAHSPDTGYEWFEVYNASSRPVTLDRLLLLRFAAAGDRVEARRHVVRGAGRLAPGQYFVFGDGVVGAQPIQYSYRNDTETFGSMSNGTGGVGLRCMDRDIDIAWYSDLASSGYAQVAEGRSLSFDGGVAPDAVHNDEGELWCSGGAVYDGTNLGSPGQENIACGAAACDEDGTLRDLVRPESGDLVITELFGDASGSDTAKEWVELYVASTTAVDLNGLRISTGGTVIRDAWVTDLACVRGEPGDFLVLGGSADLAVNGGVAVDAVAAGLERAGGMLVNSGGSVELWRGQELIDRAQVPDYEEGHSMSLEPLDLSSAGNDATSSFCPAASTGLFDGAGTPGVANDPCRSCWTGSTYREPISPDPGDLVLTEVLPNPAGTDSGQEWIELYVAAERPVDLVGLHLENQAGSLRRLAVTGTDCTSANPGAFVVLGGELIDPLDVTVSALLAGDDLYNEGATLSLLAGATVIDAIPAYNDPGPGVSWSLDPGVLHASGNDVATHWCAATDTGLFSGNGSPGQANGTVCP